MTFTRNPPVAPIKTRWVACPTLAWACFEHRWPARASSRVVRAILHRRNAIELELQVFKQSLAVKQRGRTAHSTEGRKTLLAEHRGPTMRLALESPYAATQPLHQR